MPLGKPTGLFGAVSGLVETQKSDRIVCVKGRADNGRAIGFAPRLQWQIPFAFRLWAHNLYPLLGGIRHGILEGSLCRRRRCTDYGEI